MRQERLFVGLAAALLVALASLVLTSFRDYAGRTDARARSLHGDHLLRWYASLGDDRSAIEDDLAPYGGLSELVMKAAQRLSPFSAAETRHLVGALFGLVGLVAAFWAGRALAGAAGGLVSATFLAVTPLFYGSALEAARDVPFASLHALAAAALVQLRLDRMPGAGSRVLAALVGVGVCVGLASAERVAGLALLVFAALGWLFAIHDTRRRGPRPLRRRLWQDLARIALDLAIVSVTAWLVMALLWPYVQIDPFVRPFQAFAAFFDGPFGEASLRRLLALAAALPELYLVAFALGLWRIVAVLRQHERPGDTRTKLAHFAWLLAAMLGPLLVALLWPQTPWSDRGHPLVFPLPGLAVLAGASCVWWLRGPSSAALRAALGTAVAAAVVLAASDMVALHPRQSSYVNRLLGGPAAGADADVR